MIFLLFFRKYHEFRFILLKITKKTKKKNAPVEVSSRISVLFEGHHLNFISIYFNFWLLLSFTVILDSKQDLLALLSCKDFL